MDILKLRDFRNYFTLELELSHGLNLLAGANAQGKTSVLEGLYFASSARMLRGIKETEAIREGAESAEVAVTLTLGGTELAIQIAYGQRKRALLNKVALPRAADLLGRLPTVCLSSADLPIVQGGASERRMFLDIEISQLYPAYVRKLATYKRSLEHRNALLKQRPLPPRGDFEPWEAGMAASGADIRSFRERFVEGLSPASASVHSVMGTGEQLSLEYLMKDSAIGEDGLREEFERTRFADSERGSTSIGPHRDDLLISIEGQEARLFGSQGQQRTAVIALKLGVHELGRQKLGTPPLLLLDDMLSDLDSVRRASLVSWVLQEAGQAVLTCTEIEVAGKELSSKAKVFGVEKGTVHPA